MKILILIVFLLDGQVKTFYYPTTLPTPESIEKAEQGIRGPSIVREIEACFAARDRLVANNGMVTKAVCTWTEPENFGEGN